MNRDADKILDAEGECNGWVFLYPFYRQAGREKEYKALLQFINHWDSTVGSLGSENLPPLLKGKYARERTIEQNGVKTTIVDEKAEYVFESLINDLNWFYAYGEAYDALALPLEQGSRIEQYGLVAGDRNPTLQKLAYYVPSVNLNRSQLIEMLALFSHYQDATIDIDGGGHATNLTITANGEYAYL